MRFILSTFIIFVISKTQLLKSSFEGGGGALPEYTSREGLGVEVQVSWKAAGSGSGRPLRVLKKESYSRPRQFGHSPVPSPGGSQDASCNPNEHL